MKKPHDENSEVALLGSVLIDGGCIQTIQDKLQPDDFYSSKNQKIYSSMLEMFENNIPIDVVSLFEHLKSKGWHEQVGGSLHLTYLIELTPSSANYRHYASSVKEASRLRKISEFTQRIKQSIDEGKTDFLKARDAICNFYDDISKEKDRKSVV